MLKISMDPNLNKGVTMIYENSIKSNYITCNFSEFYLSYVNKSSSKSSLFLSQENNFDLSINSSDNISGWIIKSDILDIMKPKQVLSVHEYFVCLTSSKLFVSSIVPSFDVPIEMDEVELPDEEILTIKISKNNIMILTQDRRSIYVEGTDASNWFGINTKPIWRENQREFVKLNLPQTEEIDEFDTGTDYLVYSTKDNRLYVSGRQFNSYPNIQSRNDVVSEITAFEDENGQILDKNSIEKITPICSHYENAPWVVTLLLIQRNGKNELWSHGFSNYGRLGQGENKTSFTFHKWNYDSDNINFIKASISYSYGMALSDKNELYMWGENHFVDQTIEGAYIYSPEKMPQFADYLVYDFRCGNKHAIVKASKKSNPEEINFYLLDDKQRAFTDQEKLEARRLIGIPVDKVEYFWVFKDFSFFKMIEDGEYYS
jgi:hypothetical protein